MLTDREETFFKSFNDFTVRPDAPSIAEFCRLAEIKGWVQGSDVFASFWKVCFDSNCPGSTVGHIAKNGSPAKTKKMDAGSIWNQSAKRTGPSPPGLKPDLTSLEKGLQNLDLHTSSTTSAVTSLHAPTPASSVAGDGVLITFFDTFPSFTPNSSTPLREEFDRLAELQKWSKNSQLYRDQWTICCADEFSSFYHESRLEAWQAIYTDITGLDDPPPTLTKCRKV